MDLEILKVYLYTYNVTIVTLLKEIFNPEKYTCGKHNHNIHLKVENKGISNIISENKQNKRKTTQKIQEKTNTNYLYC